MLRAVARVGQMVHIGLGEGLDPLSERRAVLHHLLVGSRQIVGGRQGLEGLQALVQVAEEAGTRAALGHALGQLALGRALLAQRALLHDALFLVEVAHAVGAAHDAELAADALRLVNLNGAVGQLVRRLGGTHRHALGVLAVLAGHGPVLHLGIVPGATSRVRRVAALGEHAVPQHAIGHVVLHLAGQRAGVAADAAMQINANSELRHGYSPTFLISMSVSL